MGNLIIGLGEALWDVLPEGKKLLFDKTKFAGSLHSSSIGKTNNNHRNKPMARLAQKWK